MFTFEGGTPLYPCKPVGGALTYATFTWGAPPLLVYKGITITRVNTVAKEASFCSRTPSMFLQCLIEGGKGKIYTFIFAVKVA